MKNFLTIFPNTENVHLIKDVGMIPYTLHKDFGYDSTIASYENGEYSYLNSEVLGLKQVFIPKIFNHPALDSCFFVLLNFWKYDIVQCYHFTNHSLLILFFFKVLKKITFSNSFTYLKLDADDSAKELKVKKIHKFFMCNIDLLSVETKGLYEYFNSSNIFEKDVVYIPNGFYSKGERQYVDFSLKNNVIITVGRIGTFQKYNETLLEAFKEFALKNIDWNLEIIGPIENSFQNYIQEYFELNPNLIDRVLFTGSIADRAVLEEKYKKAKIFVLSSRFEGFPLVYLEAIKTGCTIISSAITPAYDITDNEKYGNIFPIGDSRALVRTLEKVIDDPIKLENDCKLIQDFAYDNFLWSKICDNIDNHLQHS